MFDCIVQDTICAAAAAADFSSVLAAGKCQHAFSDVVPLIQHVRSVASAPVQSPEDVLYHVTALLLSTQHIAQSALLSPTLQTGMACCACHALHAHDAHHCSYTVLLLIAYSAPLCISPHTVLLRVRGASRLCQT